MSATSFFSLWKCWIYCYNHLTSKYKSFESIFQTTALFSSASLLCLIKEWPSMSISSLGHMLFDHMVKRSLKWLVSLWWQNKLKSSSGEVFSLIIIILFDTNCFLAVDQKRTTRSRGKLHMLAKIFTWCYNICNNLHY